MHQAGSSINHSRLGFTDIPFAQSCPVSELCTSTERLNTREQRHGVLLHRTRYRLLHKGASAHLRSPHRPPYLRVHRPERQLMVRDCPVWANRSLSYTLPPDPVLLLDHLLVVFVNPFYAPFLLECCPSFWNRLCPCHTSSRSLTWDADAIDWSSVLPWSAHSPHRHSVGLIVSSCIY